MKQLFLMILMMAVSVCGWAQSQPQLQDNLVDRVSRTVGVRLPDGYEAKVKDFVAKSKVLEGSRGEFTEQWISGQMKSNWGVNKQNQLLFIWDAVYEQLKGKDKHIYTGEDGNEQRLNDLDKVMYKTEACGLEYTVECRISPGLQDLDTSIGKLASINPTLTQETNTYKKKKEEYALREKSIKSKLPNYEQFGVTDMTSLKKEVKSLYDDVYDLIIKVAERRSAEADRRSAEAEQQSIFVTYYGWKQCIAYYQLCKNHPTLVKPNELAGTKDYAKHVTQNCKKYKIDYYSLLPLEVQKFYDIEPSENKYNHVTCEQAQVQIMKIVLSEMVKYYNLCQKTPQATHDNYGKKCFEESKGLGMDYKAILRKELGDDKKVAELLKFYGVE